MLKYYSFNYRDFLKKDINSNSNDLINKLRNELNTYKNENTNLKNKINQLKIDNDKLNTELIKANKIISNFNNIQNNQQGNNNIINNLNEMIKMKANIINDLKNKLQNSGNDNNKLFNFNDILIVHFISLDQKINHAIKCLKTDTFAEVEEKLYQQYEEYRETNNNFITKGKIVLRFKKICENNIKDGDKIQLVNV